jgi:nucleoside-diphosphate-sugar epimerase
MSSILVLGGTGNISQHTVAALVDAGHTVTVFNRGQRTPEAAMPPGVTVRRGDRNSTADLAAAIGAARPAAVLDFIGYTTAQAEALHAALVDGPAADSVRQVVFVSTVDAYGYPLAHLPATEDMPLRPAVGPYAQEKVRCETFWRAHHAPGRLEVTVTRPTYCLGRSFVASFASFSAHGLVRRLRAGLPVALPGDGSGRMHASTARDAGRMHAALTLVPAAFGRTFNTGSAGGAITHARYLELLAEAAGVRDTFRAVPVPRERWERALGDRRPGSIWDLVFRFDLAFSFDAFRTIAPGFIWQCDWQEGLRAAIARWETDGVLTGPETPEDALEAALVRAGA